MNIDDEQAGLDEEQAKAMADAMQKSAENIADVGNDKRHGDGEDV